MQTLTSKTTTSDLEQFYSKLLSDTVLQEKLKAATDLDSLCQIAVQLGVESGYMFTIEEVKAALAIEVALGTNTEWSLTEMPLNALAPCKASNRSGNCICNY
jgi:predicted ribosomally synthesized peptide with nif11-like leader